QLLSRPLRQQPVAARLSAELELLVQGEFLLEGSFPLIEAGHGLISTGSACSRDVPAPRAFCEALPDGAVAINRCRPKRWSSKPWCDKRGLGNPRAWPHRGRRRLGCGLGLWTDPVDRPVARPVDRPVDRPVARPPGPVVDRPPGPVMWPVHLGRSF